MNAYPAAGKATQAVGTLTGIDPNLGVQQRRCDRGFAVAVRGAGYRLRHQPKERLDRRAPRARRTATIAARRGSNGFAKVEC